MEGDDEAGTGSGFRHLPVNFLVNYICQDFQRRFSTDISGQQLALSRLTTLCERAKQTLSSRPQARLEIDGLYNGIDYAVTITRACYDALYLDYDRNRALREDERRAQWAAGPLAVPDDSDKDTLDALLSEKAEIWNTTEEEIKEYQAEGGNLAQLDKLATEFLDDYYAICLQHFGVKAAMLPHEECMVSIAKAFYWKAVALEESNVPLALPEALEYFLDARAIFESLEENESLSLSFCVCWAIACADHCGRCRQGFGLAFLDDAIEDYRDVAMLARSLDLDWHCRPLGIEGELLRATQDFQYDAMLAQLMIMAKLSVVGPR